MNWRKPGEMPRSVEHTRHGSNPTDAGCFDSIRPRCISTTSPVAQENDPYS